METETSQCRRCSQCEQHHRTVSLLRYSLIEFQRCQFILRDYTDFLEDLEEDPVLRQNVNVYKGKDRLLRSPSSPSLSV